jgi:DnaJ-class molecular chaperone
MELSDYDILGVSRKCSFREVKNAYHDLSRIYHPDTGNIVIGISKEEKIEAFKKIKQAYENIKSKLNVIEVDLPHNQIFYTAEENDMPNIMNDELFEFTQNQNQNQNQGSNSDEENINDTFKKKFNEIFEKTHKEQTIDDPFSIYYQEPEKEKRNMQNTQLTIQENKKNTNEYEFGVNYVEDHSTNSYCDIRHIYNIQEEHIHEENNKVENNREENNDDVESKLEKMLKIREENIELKKEEIEFIERQNKLKEEIQESKNKIYQERNNKIFLK